MIKKTLVLILLFILAVPIFAQSQPAGYVHVQCQKLMEDAPGPGWGPVLEDYGCWVTYQHTSAPVITLPATYAEAEQWALSSPNWVGGTVYATGSGNTAVWTRNFAWNPGSPPPADEPDESITGDYAELVIETPPLGMIIPLPENIPANQACYDLFAEGEVGEQHPIEGWGSEEDDECMLISSGNQFFVVATDAKPDGGYSVWVFDEDWLVVDHWEIVPE